jgi:hypothetical protein
MSDAWDILLIYVFYATLYLVDGVQGVNRASDEGRVWSGSGPIRLGSSPHKSTCYLNLNQHLGTLSICTVVSMLKLGVGKRESYKFWAVKPQLCLSMYICMYTRTHITFGILSFTHWLDTLDQWNVSDIAMCKWDECCRVLILILTEKIAKVGRLVMCVFFSFLSNSNLNSFKYISSHF